MCCFKDFSSKLTANKNPYPQVSNGWLIFIVNVGKYTSPMDPMGYDLVAFGKTI